MNKQTAKKDERYIACIELQTGERLSVGETGLKKTKRYPTADELYFASKIDAEQVAKNIANAYEKNHGCKVKPLSMKRRNIPTSIPNRIVSKPTVKKPTAKRTPVKKTAKKK